eukprot:scaffold140081_cov21-Tisochrysis_lutea.AAC.1
MLRLRMLSGPVHVAPLWTWPLCERCLTVCPRLTAAAAAAAAAAMFWALLSIPAQHPPSSTLSVGVPGRGLMQYAAQSRALPGPGADVAQMDLAQCPRLVLITDLIQCPGLMDLALCGARGMARGQSHGLIYGEGSKGWEKLDFMCAYSELAHSIRVNEMQPSRSIISSLECAAQKFQLKMQAHVGGLYNLLQPGKPMPLAQRLPRAQSQKGTISLRDSQAPRSQKGMELRKEAHGNKQAASTDMPLCVPCRSSSLTMRRPRELASRRSNDPAQTTFW